MPGAEQVLLFPFVTRGKAQDQGLASLARKPNFLLPPGMDFCRLLAAKIHRAGEA